jgi:hypothetical protein
VDSQREIDFAVATTLAERRRIINQCQLPRVVETSRGGVAGSKLKALLGHLFGLSLSGVAFPSEATLATAMCCSVATVQRSIRALESLNYLVAERRRNPQGLSSNRYVIVWSDLSLTCEAPAPSPAIEAPPPEYQSVMVTDQSVMVTDQSVMVTDQSVMVTPPKRHHDALPDLPKEPEDRKTPARARVEPADIETPPEIDTPEGRAALTEWLDYKRSRRESYADPRYVERLLRGFVDRHGAQAAARFSEAVAHSIGNNYAGCYEPRSRDSPGRKSRCIAYDPHAAKDPRHGQF